MSSFEEIVDGIKNSWGTGSYVECMYGTSKAGQRFAILITKGLRYALRVIMDEKYRQYSQSLMSTVYVDPDWLIREEYLTEDGVFEAARKFKDQLEKGKFLEIYKILSPNAAHARARVMPDNCVTNPDAYLQPGDLIQTNFVINTNHEGIYIGNGNVIHVSGHGGGKSESVARVGKLLGDFVSKSTDKIRVIVYPVSFQKPNEIVQIATDFANNKFREGEYNLITKNCQHFARLCVIGRGECGDLLTMYNAILNAGVAALFLGALILLG